VGIALKPWTQGIQIGWRPELRFYEVRIAILRMLEDLEILKAFRVGDNFIDAQLFDGTILMSVRQNGLNLTLAQPEADIGLGWDALTAALAQVRPAHPRNIASVFQHVCELPMSLDDAIRAGARAVPGPRLSGAVSDWAFLMDLRVAGKLNLRGQLEFGIVRAEELAPRLSRQVGRMSSSPMLDEDLWTKVQFPPVALFADTRLVTEEVSSTDELATSAKAAIAESETEASALVDELLSGLDMKEDDAVSVKEPR
jgi:hypothetical protein